MVRHATDGFGHTVERANHSAKVSMQSIPPDGGNEGFVVFCSEHEMVMKAQMCGRHGGISFQRPFGAGVLLYRQPVVCTTG